MRLSKDKNKDTITIQPAKKPQSGRLDTHIGEQTSLDGTLVSKDNISVYGNIKGQIQCQGRVVIGETGNIEADIITNDVLVSGAVVGNITAKGLLKISSTGVVTGDIQYSRIVMEEGSRFEGHSKMLSTPAVREKPKVANTAPTIAAQEKPKLPSASRASRS